MALPRAALLVVFSVAFHAHTTRGLVMMATAPLDRSKTKVCVTGANGYVAAELVQQLLSKGGFGGVQYGRYRARGMMPLLCIS
jgi:hypothetical protein